MSRQLNRYHEQVYQALKNGATYSNDQLILRSHLLHHYENELVRSAIQKRRMQYQSHIGNQGLSVETSQELEKEQSNRKLLGRIDGLMKERQKLKGQADNKENQRIEPVIETVNGKKRYEYDHSLQGISSAEKSARKALQAVDKNRNNVGQLELGKQGKKTNIAKEMDMEYNSKLAEQIRRKWISYEGVKADEPAPVAPTFHSVPVPNAQSLETIMNTDTTKFGPETEEKKQLPGRKGVQYRNEIGKDYDIKLNGFSFRAYEKSLSGSSRSPSKNNLPIRGERRHSEIHPPARRQKPYLTSKDESINRHIDRLTVPKQNKDIPRKRASHSVLVEPRARGQTPSASPQSPCQQLPQTKWLQKIKKRIELSKVAFIDSAHRNISHEIAHLNNSFLKETTDRKELKEKVVTAVEGLKKAKKRDRKRRMSLVC